ncbi:MAG: DNA translocase FtsK 4TM domain-containing protein, partial [Oligoflexia bacterium]|nr:DNA translocase FtsK 4TM domain-containing protein [Oligoflexia bacterium]
MGLIWGAAAVFFSLSLISFNPHDPSFNSISSSTSGVAKTVANLCGYIGSFLSDTLYQLFGLGAWTICVVFVALSINAFRGKTKLPPRAKWITGTLLLTVISSLLSLHFPEVKLFENTIRLGGLIGLGVTVGLTAALNRIGVGIVLWTFAAILLVLQTEKPLSHFAPQKLMEALSRGANAVLHILSLPFGLFSKSKEASSPAPTITEALEPEERHSKKLFEDEPHEGPIQRVLDFAAPIIERTKTKKSLTQNLPRRVENWSLPGVELLNDAPSGKSKVDEREIGRNAKLVEQKLAEFDVLGQVVEVRPGPAVTMYEFKPAASIKINDITKLTDDLSLALSAESLRIIAPIPGRDVVGIETSNSNREPIFMKELVDNPEFWSEDIKLPIALGKAVDGEAKIIDLRKIPHLLVAGTTGSGKSVFIMSLVTSLILRHSPKTLKLVIVDPKQVDLVAFHKLPHLLVPPVKEARPAVNTLKWLIREMEKRYRSMSRFNSKNIESFNVAVSQLNEDQLREHQERNREFQENPLTAFQDYYFDQQPYIVAVIEEFADLMSVDRSGVEPAVVRLAQMARASGIHLVIAMQSPRREVLTGLIKTNFPGRISFKVASKVDSSIILDQRGAERLLSVGDMLYLAPGFSQPQRYHGAFLRDDEMNAVSEHWVKQGEPQFDQTGVKALENSSEESPGGFGDYAPDKEEGYDE